MLRMHGRVRNHTQPVRLLATRDILSYLKLNCLQQTVADGGSWFPIDTLLLALLSSCLDRPQAAAITDYR